MLKMRSTSEVLLLSLKSCSIIATRQYVVIAIIEHDLKINRPVIEVMRILGNSLLVKDSIQELMTSIEKNQELKERDQLELDLDFE